jgi:hypothetical protein
MLTSLRLRKFQLRKWNQKAQRPAQLAEEAFAHVPVPRLPWRKLTRTNPPPLFVDVAVPAQLLPRRKLLK